MMSFQQQQAQRDQNQVALEKILDDISALSRNSNIVAEKYKMMMDKFFEKKYLPKDDYIQQLQKNVPYNKYLFNYQLTELVDYIYTIDKSLHENEEATYNNILMSSMQKAKHEASIVFDYLCGAKNLSFITQDMVYIRGLENEGKVNELIEELEFQIQYYKAHYEMVCYLTLKIIQNPEIIKFIASSFRKGQAMDIFHLFIRNEVNYIRTYYLNIG